MTTAITEKPGVDQKFYELGVGYYVAARASAMSMIATVTGNLYHHALEMLIKGHLTHNLSFAQLKKEVGHDLLKAWQRFKSLFPTDDLSAFDAEIEHLDLFEDIRYPDSSRRRGMILISWNVPLPELILGLKVQPFCLCVTRLDDLFDRLFVLCNIKPDSCLRCMSQHTLQILQYDNRHFARWFSLKWFEEEAQKRVIHIVPARPPAAE